MSEQVTDIATVVVAIVAVFVAIIAAAVSLRQVRVTSFVAGGDQFIEAMQMLQNEDARTARRTLYSISGKSYADWTPAERAAVEKVCSTYLQVAFMLKNSYLPLERFLPYTDRTVGDCYAIAEPLILDRRHREGRPSLFRHFEWLAMREEMFYRQRQWWQEDDFEQLVLDTNGFTRGRDLAPTFPQTGQAPPTST